MPTVYLTQRARAKAATAAKMKKLRAICLVQKKLLDLTWEDIGYKMDLPETTLLYRFNKGILKMDEWIQLFEILEIEKEDIEFLWKKEK